MNNLFSKSPETYEKFFNKLDMLLAEQRHQRQDLYLILRDLKRLLNDTNLQKQVDEYFDDDETSPQTEPEEQKVTNLDSNYSQA